MNQSESIENPIQGNLDNSTIQEYSVQSIQFKHSDLASVRDILSIIEQHISECPCKISLLLYNTIFCTENKSPRCLYAFQSRLKSILRRFLVLIYSVSI